MRLPTATEALHLKKTNIFAQYGLLGCGSRNTVTVDDVIKIDEAKYAHVHSVLLS